MQVYDRLPPILRAWLAQAALPWSPASCLRIWRRARAQGARPNEITAILDRAEQSALRRDATAMTIRMPAISHASSSSATR